MADRIGRRRASGYRLLGGGFDYLLHLRPAEWPIVAAHTAVGALLATGLPPSAQLLPDVVLGMAIWVICLNGGTLAINSAFDRDTADIAYLRRPPPPPRHLFGFGMALMLGGFGVAAISRLPTGYLAAYLICFALSVGYSVPPLRLKSVAGLDWFINMWGFGAITAWAGWASTGLPVHGVGQAVILAFCPLFAGLYPLTQLYQLEDDAARGDRTMALVLGVRDSLRLAIGSVLLGFGVLALAGLRAGWSGDGADLARWIGLAVGATVWILILGEWSRSGSGLTPAGHQQRMYRALVAWAVTDFAVLGGFVL